ncbi:MAG TPA: PsiF family protein [Burkholderiaceae bacterium]|nr:PsiF family protein [Burkholderiaceae bacterium]
MIGKILIAACLVVPVAVANADEKKLTPQQQKMSDCSKQSAQKKLSGDARKAFMSTCLKGDTTAAPGDKHLSSQQQKMSECSKQAGDKKLAGDEHKAFMSTCLKG